jgi:hypothetical protein
LAAIDRIALLLTATFLGTRKLYLFVRRTLGIPFHDGTETLDQSLEKVYKAIKNRDIIDTVNDVFSRGD